jgi:phosphoribosylcarboxyaminoimidazole (NCAIR) mutase
MRSIAIPSLSHQTEGFDKLNSALGLAKGTVVEAMAIGNPRSENNRSRAVMPALRGLSATLRTREQIVTPGQ